MKSTRLLPLMLILAAGLLQAGPYDWHALPFGGAGFVCGVITCPSQKGVIFARTDVGGAYRWNPQDQSWTQLLDWVAENEKGYLGVESLAVDPSAPNRVYLLAGTAYWDHGKSAILRSEDSGATFEVIDTTELFKAHGNGMGRQNGERLAVDPRNGKILIAGTRRDGMFRSSDYGRKWEAVASFPVKTTGNDNGICFVLFDPRSGQKGQATPVIYAGVSAKGQNVFMSKDAGKSWQPIPGLPGDLMPQRAALAPDGTLYLTYGSEAGPWNTQKGGVWKLDTRTLKSAAVTPAGYEARPFGGITVSAGDPKRIACSTINTWLDQGGAFGDKFFLSTNAGQTWRDLGGKRDNAGVPWLTQDYAIHWAGSIEFDPFDSRVLFVTSGNGVFRMKNTDSDPTWTFTVAGLEETVPLDMVCPAGGPVLTVVADYDGCSYTNTSSYGKIFKPQMGSTDGIAVGSRKPEVQVRVGRQVYYSGDKGKSWSLCSTNNYPGKKIKGGKLAVSADGKVILWWPDGYYRCYRSADKGKTWKEVKGFKYESYPVADPVNAGVFYAYDADAGTLNVSMDQGKSFSKAGDLDKGCSRLIRCVPGREGDVWVAGPKGLFRSKDSGKSFTQVNGPSSCRSVGFGKAAEGSSFPAIYVWGTIGNIEGLYRSDDEAKSWIRINDAEHEFGGPGNAQLVTGDPDHFGKVYMTTSGLGVICGEPKP